MSLLRGLPPQRWPGTSPPDGGAEAEGRLPRRASGRGAAENPGSELFSGYSWHEAPRSPVTRFWRRSPSLRKIVAPVCRLGKYPLRSPSSHELSLLPPGHQPLPTCGLRVWVFFFPPSPAACRALVKRGAQPGSAWFEEEKGVLLLFFFYLLFQAPLEWRWLHPRGKIVRPLRQGNRIKPNAGGLLSPKERPRRWAWEPFLPGW